VVLGTYGNYCGPTPEIDLAAGCVPHGRFGDDPIDAADAACQRHDLNYCACDRAWISRRGAVGQPAPQTGLSALTAVRGLRLGARPLLEARGADDGYFECVSEADALLVRDGIAMRAQAQQSDCINSGSESGEPEWFCEANNGGKKDAGTLVRFERINLALFLRALDFDLAREDDTSTNEVPFATSQTMPLDLFEPSHSGAAQPSFNLAKKPRSSVAAPQLPLLTSKKTGASSELSLVQLEEQRRDAFQQALRQGGRPSKGMRSAASAVSKYDESMEARLDLFRTEALVVGEK